MVALVSSGDAACFVPFFDKQTDRQVQKLCLVLKEFHIPFDHMRAAASRLFVVAMPDHGRPLLMKRLCRPLQYVNVAHTTPAVSLLKVSPSISYIIIIINHGVVVIILIHLIFFYHQ